MVTVPVVPSLTMEYPLMALAALQPVRPPGKRSAVESAAINAVAPEP
jgi:hypothetical protein